MYETNSLNFLDQTTPRPRSTDIAAKAIEAAANALFERLGVGGMGEVYRFGDDALRRDLAVKVLKVELRGNAHAEERFLREARLAGSLQHPGVVPIHQLGRLRDGRPCYTMKLVRGRTLADLLREEPEGPERLPRLLAILEKVCQAVAYAHSKRVIHRDLKPSNVMVGEFGEVQVMDWGLAKELSRSEHAPPTVPTESVETAAWTEEGEGLSRAGSALGTPAYMPPEQAAGDWDIVDERADVFALGAVLCEMLTGRPPYHGTNRDDLLRRARRGDLAEALEQLKKCGADTVLVNLCRECLAPERLQRPRHGGVVAERLASYQAEVRERLRQAELERARTEVKALEERKRRRLIAALTLSALVLLVGGGAAWWQWQRRQAETDGAVAVALGEARSLWEQALLDVLTAAGYDKAVAAAHNAQEMARAGGASEDMQRQAQALFKKVKQDAELAAKDRRLLAALLEAHGPREGPKYRQDDKGMMMALAEPTLEEEFASAFRAWGLDVETTPTEEATVRLKARPVVVVTEVIAALDEWARQLRVDKRLETEKRVAELAAALDDSPSSLRRELRDILTRGQLPIERALGFLSAALRPVPVPMLLPLGEDRRRLRQLGEKADPATEPVLGLLTLTQALREADEEALAERSLRAALTARPGEIVLYHTLGQLLTEQKPPRWAEAMEFYRAARGLRPDLGVNLARALLGSSHADDGLALLNCMIRENPDNPDLHNQQGMALVHLRKFVDAETAFRKAIALKPDYADVYVNLGAALCSHGRVADAETAFRKVIVLKPDRAQAYANLGAALSVQGKMAEGEAACRKAIALKPDEAMTYGELGLILLEQRKYVESEVVLRRAIALKPDYSDAYFKLGNSLNGQGKVAGAEAAYRKAIELKPDDASAYNNLGNVLNAQGKATEAEAAYRKAIALKPDDVSAYSNLGAALGLQRKFVEAVDTFRKAIALKPDDASAYNNLGNVLNAQGKATEAEAAYRKATVLNPDQATAHYNLGNVLKKQEKPVEAEAAFRKAIALKPYFAEVHCNLGGVLRQQGRFSECLVAYRRGHELGSKQAGWTYPSLQWVRTAERLVELEKKLPAILQGKESLSNADDTITLAWMCRQFHHKRYAASARLYADAFTAEPKLAADNRYDAACSAALAAAAQGEDARSLPDKARSQLRLQALFWLHDDLMAYARIAQQNNPEKNRTIQEQMTHWRSDSDLASIRDPQALDRLPENERAEWQALWREVDQLAKAVARRIEPNKLLREPY